MSVFPSPSYVALVPVSSVAAELTTNISLPAPAVILSAPAPLLIVSAPPPATITLASLVPVIVLSPSLPVSAKALVLLDASMLSAVVPVLSPALSLISMSSTLTAEDTVKVSDPVLEVKRTVSLAPPPVIVADEVWSA